MAYTYDVTTPLGQLRLAIGDTVAGAGPRPDGSGYTDAELGVYLTPVLAAGYTYGRSVPWVLRQLATEWARYSDVSIDGYSERNSLVADNYLKAAARWELITDTTGAGVTGGITVGTMTLANRVLTLNTNGTVT